MELQEFVKQSFMQIAQGVMDAQKELGGKGAKVNPQMRLVFSQGEHNLSSAFGWAVGETANPVQLVEFDVAVTAEEGTQTKGGIGVVAGILALGSQGQSDKSNAAISRLKFHVPLLLPIQK